jgi:hypothetical protein
MNTPQSIADYANAQLSISSKIIKKKDSYSTTSSL